jgi:hypothetical protein
MKAKFSILIFKHPANLIIFLIFVVTLFQLGSWGLTETSEARYAQIAKEMFESGDYIHPKKMGISHYHKPPLTYYITAIGYSIFGINEYGARFFLSIALLLQLILIYKTSILIFKDKKTALLAIILYISTPIVLASTRNLTTDAYLNTFVLMAIFYWLKYLKNKKFFFPFYIALSLGFFTKGPLVFIPVFLFQVTWLYYEKRKIKCSIYDLWGVLLFLITCGWWYLAVIWENSLVLNYFTSNQIYQRIVSNDAFNRGKPFWYYILFLPISLFPWVIYLFFTFKKTETTSIKRKILLATFFMTILLFSVFKTKLIFYILPSLIFLILFASNKLTELSENYWKKFTLYLYSYFILLFILILAAILFHKIELDLPYLLIPLSGLFISFFGLKNRKWFYKNIYTLLTNTLALILFSTFVLKSNELLINSVKPIASFVNTLNYKNVYVYNYLLPSMSFYTNKNIITINNGNYTCKREIQFEQNLNYLKNYYNFEDNQEIIRFKSDFNSQNAVFLVRKKENVTDNIKHELSHFKHQKNFEKWILFYN